MKAFAFQADPWQVAKAHYERETLRFMAALMRQLGVTQVEIPFGALVLDATVEMYDTPTGKFYRIVGELKLSESQSEGNST